MIVFSILLGLISVTHSLPIVGLQVLFPAARQYTYEIKTNISCGTQTPVKKDSYWTLEGRLSVQVYDNFTRVRYTLSDLKTSIYSKNHGYQSYKRFDAAKFLLDPWEVDYEVDGNINWLYVTPDEPLWATNMKRALSFNFQIKKDVGTYYNIEPCLYQNQKDCQVVYVANRHTIHKYNALHILSENSGYSSWMSVPVDYSKAAFFGGPEVMYNGPGDYNGPLDNIGTADRTYQLDDKIGLKSLDLKGVFKHKTRNHIMAVVTDLSLTFDSDAPLQRVDKLNLTRTSKRYLNRGYTDPTNGIRNYTQSELKEKTYKILMKIASKGIDADNIVKNASKIHSLDFVNLLKTMSQLDYASLNALFEDMVLGTSYDVETSRNIFLEVLPHVRTNAFALFIKYLVVEQKSKIEDATLLSLIRKLPFNVANHSQELLQELEVLTRLSLSYSEDIRYAGILSFSTLVYKAAEVRQVQQDYFDTIVIKYFRMYSDCPQYIDRLVWLQGLSNIQYFTETYMWTVFNNLTYSRHERFWAILATTPVFAPTGYAAIWHILMNEEEHIQIRIAALHSFLSSKIQPSELLSIHNYIMGCQDHQLKRFWYTTVKSLDNSKTYNGYRVASNYIPFLTNQVNNPDSKYWATGNQILGSYDEETATGAMLQLMTIGDPGSGLPVMLQLRIKTVSELMATSDVALFIKAEGVATNMFNKIHTISPEEMNLKRLAEVLEKMKVKTLTPEKVHIEVVVKFHDKTVYATHFNQSRFDSWNGSDLTKSIDDFLRFGSHINQQMVYYPFQLDANIPTELGTPVSLQTAVVSFSSLRGNLTRTPADLTWRNDLHFRYQGTAVTSLSTDGPLLRSEHTVRVQQSVVAHLPMKFDIELDLNGDPPMRTFNFRWPIPMNAGLAMHARSQISMDSLHGTDTYTVNAEDIKTTADDYGVFFDCNQPMTVADVLEKLIVSQTSNFDYLKQVHPSVLLLNTLQLLSAPPSSSCGLVVGGRGGGGAPPALLHARVSLAEMSFEDDRLRVGLVGGLVFRELDPEGKNYLDVGAHIQLESETGNTSFQVLLHGTEPHQKSWTFCLKQHDKSGSPPHDLSRPPAYDGILSISYSDEGRDTCPDDGTRFQFKYKGLPGVGDDVERYFEINVSGSQLPKLDVLTGSVFGTSPSVKQVLQDLDKDALNVTAVIKEKNGIATVSLNNGKEKSLRSDSFAWLLDGWSAMQIMKKIGLYRECRIHEGTVQTLSGIVERLPQEEDEETLAVADCTDTPRFAVFRTKSGGVRMFMGGNDVLVTRFKNAPVVKINGDDVECAGGCSYPQGQLQPDFKITFIGATTKIQSRVSGVLVYEQDGATVVLIAHAYMHTACGICV